MSGLKDKRLIYLVITVSVLIATYFYFFYFWSSEPQNKEKNKAGHFGSESALLHLALVIPQDAKFYEIEVKRIQDGLRSVLSNSLENGEIYLRTVPEPKSEEELRSFFNTIENAPAEFIVLSPFESRYSNLFRLFTHENKVPHLFFSQNKDSVCKDNEISDYLWNLGITPEMYMETFLAFLYQRIGKVASEPEFFLYITQDPEIQKRVSIFKNGIKELGFDINGSVIVDERYDDLYTTIRSIFSKRPDMLIGFMSPRARVPFFEQSAKLGLSFEMGVVLEYGTEEEELRRFGSKADGVLIPVTYVKNFESEHNNTFIKNLENYQHPFPTMASYKGYLLGKILNKILSKASSMQIDNQDLPASDIWIKALRSLDKEYFEGPMGNIMFYSEINGLIQPIHVAEFKEGSLKHTQFLGDVTLSPEIVCSQESLAE